MIVISTFDFLTELPDISRGTLFNYLNRGYGGDFERPAFTRGTGSRFFLPELPVFCVLIAIVCHKSGMINKEVEGVCEDVRNRWAMSDSRGGAGHAHLFSKKILIARYSFPQEGRTELQPPAYIDSSANGVGDSDSTLVIDLVPIAKKLLYIFDMYGHLKAAKKPLKAVREQDGTLVMR